MSMINKMRKNTFKKGTGFSKYDNEGRVVYSESVGRTGERVQHFYEYDNEGRRTWYSEQYDNGSIGFEESTVYMSNGSYYKQAHNYNTSTTIIKTFNDMGKCLSTKTIEPDGTYTLREYDAYRDKYKTTQGADLFVYCPNHS